MSSIHYDYETTSLSDITKVGAYRYAADPSTRVLMFAVAEGDGEPMLWRFDQPNSTESLAAKAALQWAIMEDKLVYAHNYQFELAISHYRLAADVGIPRPPAHDKLRCTQAMCRRAAIPESLGKAAEFLKLDQQKENIGKALIKIFSDQTVVVTLEAPLGAIDPATQKVMRNGQLTKGTKPKSVKSASPILDSPVLWDWRVKVAGELKTVREAWELFCEYCRQDVRTERELHAKLRKFELTGDELASFQFDLRMNFRGVPVNLPALRNAQQVITEYQGRLEVRMEQMCGLRSSQGAKLQVWLRERGFKADNLQADTVEALLANPPADITPLALEVLRYRSLLSFSAIKKIPTMLDTADAEGLVRGTTVWHGARTGRATGRIIQPQNMKKATIKDSAFAYRLICDGFDLSWFEDLWDSPLEVMSSCCRHFIQLPDQQMLDADYVGVEARIAPWLAGETEKLQSILDGVDQYKSMAADIVFNIPYEAVTKDQRTVGKPIELSCVYGTGGEGLLTALRETHKVQSFLDMPDKAALKTCNDIVKAYRDKFPKLVQCWRDMEEAAKKAIRTGESTQVAEGKLGFGKVRTAGIEYLVMRLPSGRRMYYPRPEIKAVFKKYKKDEMELEPWKKEKGGYWMDSISFYGKTEQVWCRIHTWGSRLFENACQAIGADLLNYGCIQAESEGYPIFMIVHDQALCADVGLPLEGYREALCRKQPWAETFPLEADANVVPFYLKD